jgi:hypothetical protein
MNAGPARYRAVTGKVFSSLVFMAACLPRGRGACGAGAHVGHRRLPPATALPRLESAGGSPLARLVVADQLAGILRDQIQSGKLAPGGAVPSVKRLRQEYGVAETTARRPSRYCGMRGSWKLSWAGGVSSPRADEMRGPSVPSLFRQTVSRGGNDRNS